MLKGNNGVVYEPKDVPICVFYNAFDTIMKSENRSDILLLYLTYRTLISWEDTHDFPIEMLCTKTGMNKVQIRRAKKELEELGLLEQTPTGWLINSCI